MAKSSKKSTAPSPSSKPAPFAGYEPTLEEKQKEQELADQRDKEAVEKAVAIASKPAPAPAAEDGTAAIELPPVKYFRATRAVSYTHEGLMKQLTPATMLSTAQYSQAELDMMDAQGAGLVEVTPGRDPA